MPYKSNILLEEMYKEYSSGLSCLVDNIKKAVEYLTKIFGNKVDAGALERNPQKFKEYFRKEVNEPLPGNKVYNALKDKKCIILACNPRIIPGVAKGILRAAKDRDAAIIMEISRSECDQYGGYTGLTPLTFAYYVKKINEEVKHDVWVLHADHVKVERGDEKEMNKIKELIDMYVHAGFTSFAIDASHLFNFEGKTIEEELEPNVNSTVEVWKYIKEKMGNREFGLEVEVGEVGRKDEHGFVLTKPEEAVVYIRKLKEAGVEPNLLAIANGSTHGNIYDEKGRPVPQLSIDVELTKKVAKALRDNGFDVRIAQHGITGTPLELIEKRFPKGDVLKGNVATLFQNIAFDALKRYHPELWEGMFEWTLKNKPIEGKGPEETFGKNGKYAIKQFFEGIYSMSDECEKEIEEKCYRETCKLIRAFGSEGTASVVREAL